MLPVADLRRAAAQLGGAAVFAVVIAGRAVVHHGRDVGEGALATETAQTLACLRCTAVHVRSHMRSCHTAAVQMLPLLP